ncbi:MAG: phosphodiester glycosidase family protein, partial [Verrucomicrobiaceae bacterium]|nr:phosphodiester glycosidase family protein [Verrucomicrobiaceae bacterium]
MTPVFGSTAPIKPTTTPQTKPSPTPKPEALGYPSYPPSPAPSTSSSTERTSPPETLHPAASHHQIRVLSPANSIDLDLVIFDSRQLRLAVIDQPNPNAGGRSIASLMRQCNAVAGVNGGFFSPDFKPLGLSISNGRLLSSFTTSSLIAGTALQLGDQSYLIWNSEYQGHSNITDALQSGPRLLESSRPIKGLDTSNSRARTFIATDGSFLWAIGTADSCSLGALAKALATPGALPGLTPMRALNLDGGNSTALWFRNLSGKETSHPGWSTVR